jgi:HSP20 family protein
MRNPTGWMWQEAMDLLDQAERLHRQFFQLGSPGRTQPVWEPPVNVFEDEREVTVVVALPGVGDDHIDVRLDGNTLTIRAESRAPCSSADCDIRRLEIPYGYFERRIQFPGVQLVPGTRDLKDGCLVLTLRKRN